jgi:hypothetical protein
MVAKGNFVSARLVLGVAFRFAIYHFLGFLYIHKLPVKNPS